MATVPEENGGVEHGLQASLTQQRDHLISYRAKLLSAMDQEKEKLKNREVVAGKSLRETETLREFSHIAETHTHQMMTYLMNQLRKTKYLLQGLERAKKIAERESLSPRQAVENKEQEDEKADG